MSWIFSNPNERRSTITGSNELSGSKSDSNALLSCGSIVVEFEISASSKVPSKLLSYECSDVWQRRFIVYLNADSSLSVECQQGNATSYTCLSGAIANMSGALRLTYSWDAPNRVGLLAVENTETGSIRQLTFEAPVPIPLSDAKNLIVGPPVSEQNDCIRSIAITNDFQRIGPRATIGAGAMVETAHGPRPIEKLGLGEMVVTKTRGAQPIRWIVKQELPSIGQSTPMKICAPYFGLSSDIVVSQDQRVVISGAETEYQFGENAVLVEAGKLEGHPATVNLTKHPTQIYYQLLFDHHECFEVSGAWIDSLFIGNLAKSPELIATSTLVNVPKAMLPLHHKHIHPILRKYETRALLDTLIA